MNKIPYILSLIVLLLSISWAEARDDNSNTNMKFYHLDVEVDLDKSFLKGKMYCEFVAIKEGVTKFRLDLTDDLVVSKVDGASSFEQITNTLIITLEGGTFSKRTNAVM